ncbi:hypothetical protein G1J88_10220 [Tenacibaculum dicentrarchi]|uniref:Lipoprotein n=1 Tax=Tenacibaculum finnmarkense genomovar finnmarkense TaxID=1458503 RepID=A0AAP1RGE0_9FLAO|nr:hypothetical protein [Tenacibaculum finnmarkense]MCD8405867.1 hypothetical protein [Tenacibaculum dicentrarchi]MBE7653266.1 hypothetical protein [Tenacibaculum finnmarkense genomovar finnmarkense]MBE7695567.1 hypothetical protein [Tenacibaculum finnmarkense genomovar finnmarkense]MCD8403649.1 hypothetical protein [Tenacibaculum finnmarkense genomovar finnmarkense]MCD8408468.1 hypothetical protein [Tenacibaculum dicentrarchi]
MKKLQVVVLVIFSTFILTSCTDDTDEKIIELNEKEISAGAASEFIDKDKVETPTTKG